MLAEYPNAGVNFLGYERALELYRWEDDGTGRLDIVAPGNRMISLQARFGALGDTWQDQEHEKFAEEFKQTMKALKKFIEEIYLYRTARNIRHQINKDWEDLTVAMAVATVITGMLAHSEDVHFADGLKDRIEKTVDGLRREFTKVRTGRANLALLENNARFAAKVARYRSPLIAP